MSQPSVLELAHRASLGPEAVLGVRVEASSVIPAGTLVGPYPGHFLLGYILTDERTTTHVMKVKYSGGKVTIDHPSQPPADGADGGALPTWLPYVSAARDRHETTVEAIRDVRGFVFYRLARRLSPGDELTVWYGDELARDAGIPPLTPANIRGNQQYSCTSCPSTFQYPNTLKAHMRFHCRPISPVQQSSLFKTHMDAMARDPTWAPKAMGSSAFTPILKSVTNLCPTDSDSEKERDAKKRTPPTGGCKDLGLLGGLPARTLFPDNLSISPQIMASHPLLRFYQSVLPEGSGHLGGMHGVLPPQFLHAYSAMMPMYSPGVVPRCRPEMTHLSPPHLSHGLLQPPPNTTHQQHAAHHQSALFPMPSDKDGEPLDLLPKSLYMNKARHGKGHLCIYCGKLYSRKYGLKIHLRTHTGYKPLKCKVCLRPFGDPSNLNKHIRLHAEGETPYRCDYCGKVLVRRRDLERHVKSRHPNEWSTFETKKDLQNKSVDIDANENEVDASDSSSEHEDELDDVIEEGCCDDEIEVD